MPCWHSAPQPWVHPEEVRPPETLSFWSVPPARWVLSCRQLPSRMQITARSNFTHAIKELPDINSMLAHGTAFMALVLRTCLYCPVRKAVGVSSPYRAGQGDSTSVVHHQDNTGLCTPTLGDRPWLRTQDLTPCVDGDSGDIANSSPCKGRSLSIDASGPEGPRTRLEHFQSNE